MNGFTPEMIHKIRQDFPAYRENKYDGAFIYFDSAAKALTVQYAIDEIMNYWCTNGANIHRGIHRLSSVATEAYENARHSIAFSLGASANEIIFVRNTTEAINVVAHSLAPGSRVLITSMEHHSNYVCWKNNFQVEEVPLESDGTVDLENMLAKITPDLSLVALAQVSNVFGVTNRVDVICERANAVGVPVLIDGAQAIPHTAVNMPDLGCTYYAFSGHKMGAPSGIGVLYARQESQARLRPLLVGGSMIKEVSTSGILYADAPGCYEAGTPHIEGALGLAAAFEYLESLGFDALHGHVKSLANYAVERLREIPRVRILGPENRQHCTGIVSFTVEGASPNLVCKVLSDRASICVRSGYLCAQPFHERMNLPGSVRASFYAYNDQNEIETMVDVLQSFVPTLAR